MQICFPFIANCAKYFLSSYGKENPVGLYNFINFYWGVWVCSTSLDLKGKIWSLRDINFEPVFKKFWFLMLTTNQLMAAWSMDRKGFWFWSHQKESASAMAVGGGMVAHRTCFDSPHHLRVSCISEYEKSS